MSSIKVLLNLPKDVFDNAEMIFSQILVTSTGSTSPITYMEYSFPADKHIGFTVVESKPSANF